MDEFRLSKILNSNHASAIKELEATMKHSHNSGFIHFMLGNIYLYQKNNSTFAIRELREAIKKGYDDKVVRKNLGWAYYKQGECALAIKEWRKSIEFGLNTEEIHLMLANAYRKYGQYDLSVKEFEKVLSVSSRKNEPFFNNKILNEIEISQRKTVLESKPRFFEVSLTSRCNLKCVMCEVWKKPWDIPKETVKEVIEYLPYLGRLRLSGGEVFLSEYFEKLIEKSSYYPNVRMAINTNGLLIDEEWAKKLVKGNIDLTYSIDGVTKDTYEYIRKGAKFEDLLRSINLINKYKEKYLGDRHKIVIGMHIVIMKSNYRQLGQVVDFAQKYNFVFLSINPIQDISGPENIFLHKDREAVNFIKKIMPEVIEKARDCGIILHNRLPEIEDAVLYQEDLNIHNKTSANDKNSFEYSDEKNSELLCHWPWQHLFVGFCGGVKPLCICRKEVGNIHRNSLKGIWNNRMMQLYRQRLLEDNYLDLCNHRCISGLILREDSGFEWSDEI